MKKVLFFILLFQNIFIQAKQLTLLDALKLKNANAIITGNSVASNPAKSSHEGKCIQIKVTNLLNTSQEILIENAYHFANESEMKQDLITTENMIVKLLPNQTKTLAVNGLCGEKTHASPNETDVFTLSYRHDGAIEQLTKILERLHTHENTAQQAMWCLTDNNSIENIYDTNIDLGLEDELVKFVANAKGISIPKRKKPFEPRKPRELRYPVEFFGSHSEHVARPTTFGFYITDINNRILVTILADDLESRKGTAKYSWGYRGQLTKGLYYLQMKKNEQWEKLEEIKVGE